MLRWKVGEICHRTLYVLTLPECDSSDNLILTVITNLNLHRGSMGMVDLRGRPFYLDDEGVNWVKTKLESMTRA